MVSISEITEEFNKMEKIFRNHVLNEADLPNNRLFFVDVGVGDVYHHFTKFCTDEGINPIYKERRFHTCHSCEHFFNMFGNVVIVSKTKIDGKTSYSIKSIYDIPDLEGNIYYPIFKKMDEYILSKKIKSPAILNTSVRTQEYGYEVLEDGTRIKHSHFFIPFTSMPVEYYSNYSSVNIGEINTNKDLLSVMDNSYVSDIETVIELIEEHGLYRGEQYLSALKIIKSYLEDNYIVNDWFEYSDKDLAEWYNSFNITSPMAVNEEQSIFCRSVGNYAHMFNTAIGELVSNIHNHDELSVAVDKYLNMVAPSNYQRPKTIITSQMVAQAESKLTELDFIDSIPRRFANMDDLELKNTIFINRNVKSKEPTIFDELKNSSVVKEKSFDYLEAEYFWDFLSNNEPKEIELYVPNKLNKNFVSLIAPQNKESKSLFKWDNNIGWSYTGNLADSPLKENVKNAGGKVDGVLRFSLQWNDENHYNFCDIDAHCVEPNGNVIYYANTRSSITHGELDIDITHPSENIPAVENIIFPSMDSMMEGTYRFNIHMFAKRTVMDNFKCEIEFDGRIYSYEYRKDMEQNETIKVAKVTLKDGKFSIEHMLPQTEDSSTMWGIKTNTFVPVKAITKSPNFWNGNMYGLKHIFIFLDGCVNDEKPRPWYNEYLCKELHDEKRVMDVMATKVNIESTDNQLSGIGISRETLLIFKVDGEIHKLIIN